MARKPKVVEEQQEDPDTLQGFPEHGDELVEEEESETPPPERPKPVEKTGLEKLQEQMDALATQIGDLRRAPAERERKAPEPEPEPEPDWDELLFKEPKLAMKKHEEYVTKKVMDQMRREYSADVSQRMFWEDFYRANPDLKEDNDLVQVTLNANLKALQDLPVETASERLAELTRQRIIRYAGERKPNTRGRAEVEGSGGRKPPPAPEPDKVVTLSDVIRKRRESRRQRAAGRGTAA